MLLCDASVSAFSCPQILERAMRENLDTEKRKERMKLKIRSKKNNVLTAGGTTESRKREEEQKRGAMRKKGRGGV